MKIPPHFLIVGAPKCGTTALHNYLSQHPSINMAPKEIHFFGKDLGYKVQRPSLEDYQNHFQNDKINGDASVWYLYSESIYDELKNFGIQPKIIVMLRNPVEVTYALHSQNLIDANEDITDFKKALELEESRKSGLNLPKNVDPPRTVLYKETANFYPHVKRLFDAISPSQIFIGFQEDLKDTPAFMQKIESFLGIEPFEGYDFKVINANKTIRAPKLYKSLKKPSKGLARLVKLLIPFPQLRNTLRSKLQKSTIDFGKRAEMDHYVKEELQQDLKQSILNLQILIQRDLSDWLN